VSSAQFKSLADRCAENLELSKPDLKRFLGIQWGVVHNKLRKTLTMGIADFHKKRLKGGAVGGHLASMDGAVRKALLKVIVAQPGEMVENLLGIYIATRTVRRMNIL
jgi:hypothetical protein